MTKLLKSLSLFFCLLNLSSTLFAQNIGGVINQYDKVSIIDYCTNSVTISNTSFFNVGDEVLLIQMKGANVFTNNDPLYGQIFDYNGAGNYEIQKIKSISANQLFFDYNIERFYDANGSLQLVNIPTYISATVSTPLTCKKWDGNTGGVLILKADTLILNDSITVSGKGFLGAPLFNETSCFNNGNGGATTYRCAAGGNCGAIKGEGATNMPFLLGRGANANGGGGGNDHNTGGGGGGSFGKGGNGGQRLNVSNTSCPGLAPGEGGWPMIYSLSFNRLFMGGAGGAGDQNNNEGTAGADGGGIVILEVKQLNANFRRICANGNSLPTDAGSDGAGGAGAAGVVLVNSDVVLGSPVIELRGGRGGNVNNSGIVNFCFGPGGGGGGGAYLVNNAAISQNSNVNSQGGQSGAQTFGGNPPACPLGTVNSAEPGANGGVVDNFNIYRSRIPFRPIQIVSKSNDTTVCKGQTVLHSLVADASTPLSYQWNDGTQGNQNLITANITQQSLLTVADTNGCQLVSTFSISVPQINALITANPDSPIVLGQSVQLNTNSGFSYQWSPAGTLSSSSIQNPIATPNVSTRYCVIITDVFNCVDSTCKQIELFTPEIKIPTAFTPNNDNVNDVFKVVQADKTIILNVRIYNRWGEMVHESDNNTGWDGKYKGQQQPAHTYVCNVTYSSVLNTQKTLQKVQSFSLLK